MLRAMPHFSALSRPRLFARASLFSTAASTTASAADARISDLKQRQEASGIVVKPRNFSFSGCGFLLPYHVGISCALQELGYLTPVSRVAGASGGAIIAAAIAADVDLLLVQADAQKMAGFGRAKGTWGNLEPSLRDVFAARFAHVDVAQLTERLTIATQQVWPKRQLVLSDRFHSQEDLCDALIASCFIPFYLSRQAMAKFRGELHVDGGLIKLVPELPDYVRVCVFHAHLMRRDDYEITPSLDTDFPFTIWELARWSLFPADAVVNDELFHLGRKSAALWAEKKQQEMESKG
jgi:hypothetical protein